MIQSGGPYNLSINVAYLLVEIHADRDTVCAGLLHDTLEYYNLDTSLNKKKKFVSLIIDNLVNIERR